MLQITPMHRCGDAEARAIRAGLILARAGGDLPEALIAAQLGEGPASPRARMRARRAALAALVAMPRADLGRVATRGDAARDSDAPIPDPGAGWVTAMLGGATIDAEPLTFIRARDHRARIAATAA